ncbi:phage tail sheath C-terminal domain-containing protein [Caballeronia sp. LZ034LL]|uniref:phage tail sheath family protein n=1 Tax=Caballeronia sp. LZ034LL TaxID=3038567 RepID=UPI002866EFAC|nr:phage tail sheath C-terminal domain-containing protein [Caballeronia sp. LZ034LL]MDR5837921.1 phage tail sheath C-terminal domain-containing protein [Caballeronia sp. LZ034LL]
MAEVVSYPGVYVAEDASPSISVNQSATAVPVFIGYVLKTDGSKFTEFECLRVNSWFDFCSIAKANASANVSLDSTFDEMTGEYSYHVTEEWYLSFVSIGIQHYFENGGGACYVCPQYSESDGSELPAAIKRCPEITLLVVIGDAPSDRDQTYGYLNTLLGSGSNYFLIAESIDGSTVPSTVPEFTAAYYPYLNRDIRAFIPGYAEIPVTGYQDQAGNTVETVAELKSINPDLYRRISVEMASHLPTEIATTPVAAMAGVYCSVDRARGCWKAPANVPLYGVLSLNKAVTNAQQATMNCKGINVIREVSGRGITPWGARTIAGADSNSDTSWRYIPVRRLFNSAEADIRKSMQTMMFEPNTAPTWEKVRGAIDSYLFSLWRNGALAGTAPEEAYFVQIGEGVTMSDTDIAAGKMIVKVGMAAARPAEFIILQFTQDMA